MYGLLAEFNTPDALVRAAHAVRSAGYARLEGYTPFPIEELPEALGHERSRVGWAVLFGALAGAILAFSMQWFADVVHYPMNVGGRPHDSWPSFIVITFELTILSGAVTALVTLFASNRLPEPSHPLFEVDAFRRASNDRFFLSVGSDDAKFEPEVTRKALEASGAAAVYEIPDTVDEDEVPHEDR